MRKEKLNEMMGMLICLFQNTYIHIKSKQNKTEILIKEVEIRFLPESTVLVIFCLCAMTEYCVYACVWVNLFSLFCHIMYFAKLHKYLTKKKYNVSPQNKAPSYFPP